MNPSMDTEGGEGYEGREWTWEEGKGHGKKGMDMKGYEGSQGREPLKGRYEGSQGRESFCYPVQTSVRAPALASILWCFPPSP